MNNNELLWHRWKIAERFFNFIDTVEQMYCVSKILNAFMKWNWFNILAVRFYVGFWVICWASIKMALFFHSFRFVSFRFVDDFNHFFLSFNWNLRFVYVWNSRVRFLAWDHQWELALIIKQIRKATVWD